MRRFLDIICKHLVDQKPKMEMIRQEIGKIEMQDPHPEQDCDHTKEALPMSL